MKEFLNWLRQGTPRAQDLARGLLGSFPNSSFGAEDPKRDRRLKRFLKQLAPGRARELRIRNVFQRYDATGDGVLDVAELASALKACGSEVL